MKKIRVIFTILLCLIVLSACTRGSEENNIVSAPTQEERSRVRMAVTVDPDGLDPHMSASASTFQVTSSIYETLVTVDRNGNIVPQLAESWEIAPDGLSITFSLRPDTLFSNGNPCDAEAVKSSFDRFLSNGVRRGDYSTIESVEVADENTVVFHFNSLNVVALSLFSYPWSAIVDTSEENLRSNPVGSGPYVLQSWIPQQSLVLERNENYRGECNIDEVAFLMMPDFTSQVTALKNGQVDLILITGDLVSQFEGDGNFTIHAEAGNGLQLMAMNNASPTLSDLRVRQAINYAVDKDAIIDAVWWGYGEKIGSHFPVVLSEYVDMNDIYPYDVEKARTLLSEAGYGEGELTLDMFLPRSYQEYVNAGQIIAQALENVGINVNIQIVEWANWLSDVYNGRNYDLTVVGHTGRLDASSLLARYRSTSQENYFNYSNKEFDMLIDAYNSELDENKRKEIAGEMQRLLAHEVPALYLQDPIQIYVSTSRLEGFETYPINIFKFNTMHFSDRL